MTYLSPPASSPGSRNPGMSLSPGTGSSSQNVGWVQASGAGQMLNEHTGTLPEDEEDFIER